jgi:hypothetical protein
MVQPVSLSDAEAMVLLELLEGERRELPSEIRRTDTIRVHDDLQQRLKLVDGLIEKFRREAGAPAS